MTIAPLAILALAAAAAAAAPSARAQAEIRIAQSIGLSGGIAEHGNAAQLGIRAAVERANAEGGIRGRRIVLKTLDDGGSGQKAAENARELLQDPAVLALFGGIEGGPCVAQMGVAVAARVPLVGCMGGSPELRDPPNPWVFPVRAGHYEEFARLIEQSLTYGMERIAFVHADSDTGRRHLANVRKLLAARGKELALAIPLGAGKADAKAIARALADNRIESVFNHGSYSTYAEILRETRALGATTQFMAVNSGAQQMVRLLGNDARGLIFTQVVPFPWNARHAIVREHQEALRRVDPAARPSFSSLEGYISARVLVEGLRRAKSLTREGLAQALESAGPLDIGGFVVTYGPGVRQGATFVDTVVATSKGGFRS
jgi:branched-chain amino acid transport system substrate-binding protein